MEITYSTRKERKTIRMGDFRLELTLNHSSSIDKKKKWVFVRFRLSYPLRPVQIQSMTLRRPRCRSRDMGIPDT
ncbi:hypothetical protein MTR_8g020647 [Medicago truncatula]|uniref:Uncharacterized protein n=1 Tax=Medicago truncatula TaxID=3880 RepID=A0A072TY56_MEDTR|nr:hypothetical protein MTR_8g020647 [Medicago truncatula]